VAFGNAKRELEGGVGHRDDAALVESFRSSSACPVDKGRE
jgi:hypothetical protein